MMRLCLVWLALLWAASAALAAEPRTLDLGGGVKLELLPVPAGAFKMGSPPAEAGRGADEELHDVHINAGFLIGKTPVTRGQFARFAQETHFRTEAEVGTSGGFGFDGHGLVQRRDFNWRNPGFPQTDDHPVVLVTWRDATAFATWISRKFGLRAGLPGEAQWEYACRAGTTSRFYSGERDADAAAIAWFKANAGDGTRPVGQKQPNAWGLFDLSGNVYEWCWDFYVPYRLGGAVQGPLDKPRNVLRGGSWLKAAADVRSAARYRAAPGSPVADQGFRIVCPLPPALSAAAAPPVAGTAKPAPRAATPSPYRAPQRRPVPQPVPPAPLSTPADQVPRQPSSSGSLLFILPLLVVVVILGALVMTLWKAVGGGASSPAPRFRLGARPIPAGLSGHRIVDDGFWFDPTGYHSGDRVRLSYATPHGPMVRDFVVDPPGEAGQFIYTGMRPENLTLARLREAEPPQVVPPPPFDPAPQAMPQHDDLNTSSTTMHQEHENDLPPDA